MNNLFNRKNFCLFMIMGLTTGMMASCSDEKDEPKAAPDTPALEVPTGEWSEDPSDNKADIIWDISPAEFRIHIVNKAGQDLLDPETVGNLVGETMFVAHDDETHYATWTREEYDNKEKPTRDLLAIFEGLVWNGIWGKPYRGDYYLTYGGYDGYSNQKFTTIFAIERINTYFPIEYTHTIRWEDNDPIINDTITYHGFNCLNGENGIVSGRDIYIQL